jgi:glyoxylase-like metal-dependent hydrolase (beta-lactamase superfamily II)
MKTTLAAGAAAVFAPAGLGHAAGGLAWKHFPAGQNGFFRAPVLVSGPSEAVLIDGGFTLSDGKAVADAIKATGKKLTTIYISQSDPDYYFSLGAIKAVFPEARVLASPATLAAIHASVEKKLAVWGPQLKANGPQVLADVVIPEAFDGKTLSVDGETIEIVSADGLANRRYLFVPSLNAVFGGVLIFSGVHVWTADTPNQGAARRLDRQSRKDRGAQAGDRRARPFVGGCEDRPVRCRAHHRLPQGVRRRVGQNQGFGGAQGGDGSALPRPRHGRCARHRRQGRHRRDEVGLRWGRTST